MKLLAEIGKDAKSFYREQRTVTLLLLVPVIIMLVLSAVFGKATGDPTLNIKIGFCDLDKTDFSRNFIAGIETTKVVDLSDEQDCDALAKQLVSSGKLGAAVVISPGFGRGILVGNAQKITLILDNTRIQTAPSIEGFFKASAQASSQKISIEYVSAIWDKLNGAEERLGGLKSDINETKNKANNITLKLKQTRDRLESVDFSVMSNALDSANSTIKKTVDTLTVANDNLTKIEERFKDYDEALAESESDLLNISIVIDELADTVSTTSDQLNCSSNNDGVCGSLNSISSSIDNVKKNIDNRLFKIRKARTDLRDTNETIQEFKLKIVDSLAGADEANQKINELNVFVEVLQNNRRDALETLAEAQSASESLLEKINEMDLLIDDAKEQIGEITSRDPAAVVSPIELESINAFQEKTFFEFLLPGLVPIILMFLSLFLSSTSLVREKISGTLERIFISQISAVEYSLIKIVSYAIVLFPQLLILLLMSSLLYNAFSISDTEAISFLVITGMLMMIVFNALGFIIAAYSDSEATAFLASLVIGLPLLFMSGLIFPFDFMPPFMASLGEASPLSQGIAGMQSVINYNSPDTGIIPNLLAYVLAINTLAIIAIDVRMKR